MAEYIKREEAYEDFEKCNGENPKWIPSRVKTLIARQKAADVAPVRHGRWERTADGAALCTACKRKMNPSQYGYAFCSLCGAKMDG